VLVVAIFMYLRNGLSSELPPFVVLPTMSDTATAAITLTDTQLPPAPTSTQEPTPEPTITPGVVLLPGRSVGDLHMHTLCSDGHNTYEEMVQGALAQGFTFIAITDHVWCPDTLDRCRNETRLLCIPGIELTGNTHIVALNLREPIERLLPVPEQVRLIHEQGGLAIAAHPFVPGYLFSPTDLLNSGFDAIECNVDGSGDPGFDISSLTCVWSSDAHDVSKLGTPVTYTVCDVLIRNFDELKTAILGGHCTYGQ
jgi:hypothetical protein